jgi:hypothetical protein
MSSTYELRKRFVAIARLDSGKTEVMKNHAPWIEKLWPATSYPEGYDNREPYCAAGLAYCLREWLKDSEVLAALNLSAQGSDQWRCKSAAAFEWQKWAGRKNLQVLPVRSILHTADIVIYKKSHIELVTNDDGTLGGPFVAVGYNTNASGSRDGEGCFEKPRSRSDVKCFIRILP